MSRRLAQRARCSRATQDPALARVVRVLPTTNRSSRPHKDAMATERVPNIAVIVSSARYDDYADWYDAQLARFTEQATPFIRRWLGAGAGRCLDLGCGGWRAAGSGR